jgi:hypothetical protein
MELEPTLGSTVRLRLFEPLVVTVSVDEWCVCKSGGTFADEGVCLSSFAVKQALIGGFRWLVLCGDFLQATR